MHTVRMELTWKSCTHIIKSHTCSTRIEHGKFPWSVSLSSTHTWYIIKATTWNTTLTLLHGQNWDDNIKKKKGHQKYQYPITSLPAWKPRGDFSLGRDSLVEQLVYLYTVWLVCWLNSMCKLKEKVINTCKRETTKIKSLPWAHLVGYSISPNVYWFKKNT